MATSNGDSRSGLTTEDIAPGRAQFISTTIEEIREQHWRQILSLFDSLYDPFPFADLSFDTLHRLGDEYNASNAIPKIDIPDLLQNMTNQAADEQLRLMRSLCGFYGPDQDVSLSYNSREEAEKELEDAHTDKVGTIAVKSAHYQRKVQEFFAVIEEEKTELVSKAHFVRSYSRIFQQPHSAVPPAQNGWNPNDWINQSTEESTENRAFDKFSWYRRSASSGSLRALYHLGLSYLGLDGSAFLLSGSNDIPWVSASDDFAPEAAGLSSVLPANDSATRPKMTRATTMASFRSSSKLDPLSEQSRALAFVALSRASHAGYAHAQYRLACMYRDNIVPLAILESQLSRFSHSSAATSATSPVLKEDFDEEVNDAETLRRYLAVKWWSAAAEQGETRAAFQLALFLGVDAISISDNTHYRRALYWLERAASSVSPMAELLRKADKGDSSAQYQVALQFLLGSAFTSSDKRRAFEWFEKSSSQNHADAMYNLGLLWYIGIPGFIEEDVVKAKQLWKQAAGRKHKLAFIALQRAKDMDAVPKSTLNLGAVPPPSDDLLATSNGKLPSSSSVSAQPSAPAKSSIVTAPAKSVPVAITNGTKISKPSSGNLQSKPASGPLQNALGDSATPTVEPEGRRCQCNSDACVIA